MAKPLIIQFTNNNTESKQAWAEITPGKSITLGEVRVDRKLGIPKLTEQTFNVGDQAEYDSYNLSYYGPIQSITKKNVIVKDTCGKNRRLPFQAFHWRNISFNVHKKSAENSDTMRYI